MSDGLEALTKLVKVVMAYRPKPKSNVAKKRKARRAKIAKRKRHVGVK